MTELPASLTQAADLFNTHLTDWLDRLPPVQAQLDAAIQYAMTSQGKRMRPLLVLGAARALDSGHQDAWLVPALAVELVHTYSLVHDDLPAMDDDAWRRGRPTLHRSFDEATAILVGDALQALAFDVLTAASNRLSAPQQLACVGALSRAAGFSGMVGGQAMDLHGLDNTAGEPELQSLHKRKTGALIRATATLGAWAASTAPASDQLAALTRYADNLGLAFQVIDDVLDGTGDLATLGKTAGSDARADKMTYLTLLGEAGARRHANDLIEDSLTALGTLPGDTGLLETLARFTLARSY